MAIDGRREPSICNSSTRQIFSLDWQLRGHLPLDAIPIVESRLFLVRGKCAYSTLVDRLHLVEATQFVFRTLHNIDPFEAPTTIWRESPGH